MKEISRVMACVDLSDYSKMTIDYTLAIVRGLSAEILIFNVLNRREIDAVKTVSPHFPEKINVENYIERVTTDRQKMIKELIEELVLPDNIQIDILIRVGIPHKAILSAIETENIDLVVIANKGRSNLIGTLHGSNAERVFRHSPVPVLSVRNRERFTRKSSSQK